MPFAVLPRPKVFERFDANSSGAIYPSDCKAIYRMNFAGLLSLAEGTTTATKVGLMKVVESAEEVFGASLLRNAEPSQQVQIIETQFLSMQLYESRIASLHRAVAFFVMFHEMGRSISRFWPWVSFGILRYRMDRTQSIMRIATTASPVSGADVRHKMNEIKSEKDLALIKGLVDNMVRRWRLRSGMAQHEF